MNQIMERNGLSQYTLARSAWKMQDSILGIYVFCYFLVSLSILTGFPFVHSDEAWLSGLTRNMMETGDLGVTETFYDLKPRYPHAVKSLFHLLQMPMLEVFGYHIFSFRLLSLIFACLTLVLFYQLLKTVFCGAEPESISGAGLESMPGINSPIFHGFPFLGTVLLSADVQFIYASHFARQEIILVCCITACIRAVMKKKHLQAGLITGLAIGLHPNSFLIGTMCAVMLMPLGMERMSRLRSWKPLLGYAGVTTAFAAIFVSASLMFDRQFFRHYFEYGNSEFDIGAPVTSKLMELPYFFKKIWFGVSGTYYVPDIRFELVLFSSAVLILGVLTVLGSLEKKKEAALIGRGIVGMLAGMVIIGRYNQTSIVLLFPLLFLLVLLAAAQPKGRFGRAERVAGPLNGKKAAGLLSVRNAAVILIMMAVTGSSIHNILPWLDYRYGDYLKEISRVVDPDDKVLANLNTEYYFDNGKLLDYRNLSFLKEADLSVEDYIRKNEIRYIIFSDEMDLIYSQRPIWNMIYGNPRYMEELHRFLDENCTPVHRFRDNTYGVRIVQYMNSDRDFTVQIFKVKDLS